MAQAVRLHPEDTRTLQSDYGQTRYKANIWLSRNDSSTSGLEGDHIKSVPYVPEIGSLMYAMVATQSNIPHTVGIVSRFIHNPGRAHWNAMKHIFRYLVGTQDYDITFAPDKPSWLHQHRL